MGGAGGGKKWEGLEGLELDLVWVLLTAHEDEMFQCVWQSIMIVCLGGCRG